MSAETQTCPACLKKAQKQFRATAERLETKAGLGDDNTNAEGQCEQVGHLESKGDSASVVTDGLVFIENYFGNGKGTTEQKPLQANGLVEWQLVSRAVAQGHEITGVGDEIVVFQCGEKIYDAVAVGEETGSVTTESLGGGVTGAGAAADDGDDRELNAKRELRG